MGSALLPRRPHPIPHDRAHATRPAPSQPVPDAANSLCPFRAFRRNPLMLSKVRAVTRVLPRAVPPHLQGFPPACLLTVCAVRTLLKSLSTLMTSTGSPSGRSSLMLNKCGVTAEGFPTFAVFTRFFPLHFISIINLVLFKRFSTCTIFTTTLFYWIMLL